MVKPMTTVGFDPFDRAHRADPYPGYRRLRDTAPVYRNPRGHWLLTRHRDCVQVLRDQRFGHGSGELLQQNTFRRPVGGRSRPFILLDPPEHTRLRALVTKAFTPAVVARLAPRIERIVHGLLDEAIETNEVDLLEALAYPLPVTAISELLGVPVRDHAEIRKLSQIVARGVDPDFQHTEEEKRIRAEAFAKFDEFFTDLLDARRRLPADDLLGKLVTARDGGEQLSQGELLTTCVLLYVAGHETTMNLIANGVLALLRTPEEFRRLTRDPGLTTRAVEELLRYDSPTQLSRRTALTDVDVAGELIPEGAQVVVIRGAANRDPAVFDSPDRLDLGRARNPHIAFDGGIHYCLGAPLARLEGRIVFRALADRVPGMSLTSEELCYRDNLVVRGLAALPVRMRS